MKRALLIGCLLTLAACADPQGSNGASGTTPSSNNATPGADMGGSNQSMNASTPVGDMGVAGDMNQTSPNGQSNATTPAGCGDGAVGGGEVCDGADLAGATCVSMGFGGGVLSCNASCQLETSTCEPLALEGDRVAHVGGTGHERFNDIHLLSDGTYLVAAQAASLDFLPADIEVITLEASGLDSSSDNVALLLHLSADLGEILGAARLPASSAADVFRVRSTEVPGQPTGTLYISGNRDNASGEDGYYIARLDANFVTAAPTRLEWVYNVDAPPRRAGGGQGTSAYKALQPWDVSADGEIIFGRGAEYDFDWAMIEKLDADGNQTLVEHWPVHWHDNGEYHGGAASGWQDASSPLLRSGIVLKAGRKGSLRSKTEADYNLMVPDGNGGMRQGMWPDDYFFSGPCDPEGDCAGKGGYTGYRTSDKPTQRLGGIVIDRRTGDHYFGYSTQSVLPGGNPDFEPAVVAMDADGQLKWVNRLYEETSDNSTPDQYVDGLAIDYANDQVVILARAHGNNVVNLWKGSDYAHNPDAPGGFQRQFTGTSGNIHISWLGKFSLEQGQLMHASYVAELSEGLQGANGTFDASNPLLEGYPNPNAGWADLNTTRCTDVEVSLSGEVLVACRGRRTLTTNDAFQRMPKPDEGRGMWNGFARVYSSDLSKILYSTLLTGTWDWDPDATSPGGGNTTLRSVAVRGSTLIVTGHLDVDDQGAFKNPASIVPTENVPPYGSAMPAGGEDALLGLFEFTRP